MSKNTTKIACNVTDDLTDVDWEQLAQLSGNGRGYDVDPQYEDEPLKPGETIEPVLRGCQKVEKDPELSKLLYNVYRGI